jgi:hypothetical protein
VTVVPAASCRPPRCVVQRRSDTTQHDRQRLRAVAFGTHPAGAIEHAVGAGAADLEWEQRLADALTDFRDCRWPLDHLRPAATETSH